MLRTTVAVLCGLALAVPASALTAAALEFRPCVSMLDIRANCILLR